MLLDIQKIFSTHPISKRGVIHVGAHFGEEYSEYEALGIENMMFFEPTSVSFEQLVKNLGDKNVTLVNKAVGNANQEIEINLETRNDGQSNSILKPTRHLIDYPKIKFETVEIVEMVRLNDFIQAPELFSVLNMDVQGYELEVLKGATEVLPSIEAIFTEVSYDKLYENSALIGDLDHFLKDHAFFRMETIWWKKSCWGDALYIKNNSSTARVSNFFRNLFKVGERKMKKTNG